MNYGDTGFPWNPHTLPQVCVSPLALNPLEVSQAPLAALAVETGDPDGLAPAPGRGWNAVLAAQNANFATGTGSPSLTLL